MVGKGERRGGEGEGNGRNGGGKEREKGYGGGGVLLEDANGLLSAFLLWRLYRGEKTLKTGRISSLSLHD